ncbi:MAG TPA: serine/threonine-protein kinase [Solirubrobacterales bacterium]|nr:serine/threonine-protein kinase [Solirubrobacterales bacterium]
MPGIAAGELLKNRFRLERLLGHGGMAAVWLGHDEVLDRPVAVKVLSDTIAGDPEFVARFRREARTAAALSHPNLVDVYDYSEEGERPYLVMQFVPGETLAARQARGEAVDRERLARELLEALAHIHAAGILHRDVKPGNVIVEPDGTAKLIDFGIALPQDATALTSTGLILGTERFAAPEVMAGRPATERSDLYSCGVLLRGCEGRCSDALRSLIVWLTRPEPDARPASANQALARLERPEQLDGGTTQVFEPVAARPVERPAKPAPPAPPPRPEGARLRLAAILALLAAAAVVAVVVFGGGSDQKGRGGAAAQAKPKQSKQKQSAATTETTPAAASAPETEADPERGSSLNEQGYALIQAGEYAAAVPVLEEAVGAFGEGSEDLDYAYALFNLGNALRLSGRPEDAIPVLEQRLQIPNQTATVQRELEAARAEAGGGETGGAGAEGESG